MLYIIVEVALLLSSLLNLNYQYKVFDTFGNILHLVYLSLFEDILIVFGFMSKFMLLFRNLNIIWFFILKIEEKNLLIEF